MLKLSQSDNKFPINLNEVWMLAYPRKDHAVRELTRSDLFIKGIDYQVFPKYGENSTAGRPTNDYHLTIPCMEFFIARKVRPVFEVYRQVFHRVASAKLPAGRIVYPATQGTPSLIFGSYGMHTNEVFAYLRTLRTICGMDAQTTVDMLITLLPKHNTVVDFLDMAKEATEKLGLDREAMQQLLREMAASLSLPFPAHFGEPWTDKGMTVTLEKPYLPAPEPGLPFSTPQSPVTDTETSEPANIVRCKSRWPSAYPKGNRRTLPHRLHSSSFLLKTTGNLHISTLCLNETLHGYGILVKVPAKNGRSEWQLTKKGERYGANTQVRLGHAVRPLFYGDTFEEMLHVTGLDRRPEEEGTL